MTPDKTPADRLADALEEILNYVGGAKTPLEDEYVIDRANSALAAYRASKVEDDAQSGGAIETVVEIPLNESGFPPLPQSVERLLLSLENFPIAPPKTEE